MTSALNVVKIHQYAQLQDIPPVHSQNNDNSISMAMSVKVAFTYIYNVCFCLITGKIKIRIYCNVNIERDIDIFSPTQLNKIIPPIHVKKCYNCGCYGVDSKVARYRCTAPVVFNVASIVFCSIYYKGMGIPVSTLNKTGVVCQYRAAVDHF